MPSHRTTLHPSRHQGFTLIELMVVLPIIAIVALVAAPDYQSSIESSRKTSATNNLLGALQFARSEALTRRSDVRVCASSDGTTCSGSDWSTGGVVLDGSTLLRSIPPAPKVAISGNAITIKSDGTTTASSISVDDK